ncbi:HAD-IB family phosphatase [bacterium]|nr:HAD-IB family phosphatase [candidate division CSSED10-310 bacterium]
MKNYKIVVFDVDGTLTQVRSVWEYLHRKLGIWDSQGEPNLADYRSGRIDYREFARRDAAGYRGVARSRILELLESIPMRSGWSECLHMFRARGMKIALVSTGLDILVDRFTRVDHRSANKLGFDNDVCTGQVEVCVSMNGKKSFLDRLLDEIGIGWEEVVVIGDSEGDCEIMLAAGLSIAVDPSEAKVAQAADFQIDGSDLTHILPLVFDGRPKKV